jgi:tripartite ATP-independent transporter DctM subunit
MVGLFILYIVVVCILDPRKGPRADDPDMRLPVMEKLKITFSGLLPTMVLIVAVLGSLMAGIASPTEAAAVGAIGALILCICYGKFSIPMMREALAITVRISAMILLIVAGGIMFTGIFAANGGSRLIQSLISDMGLGLSGTLALFLFIVFLLGFVLDWTANVLICVPLFLPVLTAAGVDPIWFGTLVIIVIQTSYLTPPMASSIFYLLSIAPPDMKYGQVCRGVVPFILVQFATLALVVLFPALATWLPQQVSGF